MARSDSILFVGAPAELSRLRPRTPGRCLVFASWAALEPREGQLDAEALASLRRELMAVGAREWEPMLCLYRAEDPAWFTARGGWEKEDNLRCYLRYVGRLVRAVGHLADGYVTFFEPEVRAWQGKHRLTVLSHMAGAHVRAGRLIRDTRMSRELRETEVGLVLGYPMDLSALWLGDARRLLLDAVARGRFAPPLRNPLRIRPGSWSDFVAVRCPAAAFARRARAWERRAGVPVRWIDEGGTDDGQA